MERPESEAKHYQTFEDLEVYLEELLDDLNVCEEEAYLPSQEIEPVKQEGWRVHKLINGCVRFLRKRAVLHSPRVREGPGDDDLEDLFSRRFNPSSLQHFNE